MNVELGNCGDSSGEKRVVARHGEKGLHPHCVQLPRTVALGCQLALTTLLDRSQNLMNHMRSQKPSDEHSRKEALKATIEFENAITHVRKFETDRK
jgi:hypothetical protein